jgi:ribosomal protein S18 acetylase RimI-like enzyme
MSQARTAGYRSSALHVDADSLTGAVRLYERAGFTVHATNAVYSRPLSARP